MKITIGTAVTSAIVLVGIGFLIAGWFLGDTVQAAVPEVRVIDNTPQKIERLKDELVNDLMRCESAGYTEADGLITIDNNKAGTLKGDDVLSYGNLQFKTKTVQRFVKARDGRDVTPLQAKLIALDQEQAHELAKYAIFEKDAIAEWHNCAAGKGLYERVSAIKSLTK